MSERIPPNLPKVLGNRFLMKAYGGSDHAREKITRQYRSRFVMMINMAPIYQFYKKHTSVKTSTFRSYFVALKQ